MYAAAIDAGRTPATIYQDAPLVFEDENLEGLYRPKNDSGDFGGPTRMRTALYRSINLVSMRVLLDLGASNVIDYVTRFGFDTRDFPRNLQLAIGGGTMAVAPIDMARAYTVFANGGFAVEPHLISRIELQGEGVIYEAAPPVACDSSCEADRELADLIAKEAGAEAAPERERAPRVLDERTAFIMNSMLGDVVRYGTARRARALEREDLGGKTGTTNAADVWFSGFQRELAATAWVGFADNRPLGDNEFHEARAADLGRPDGHCACRRSELRPDPAAGRGARAHRPGHGPSRRIGLGVRRDLRAVPLGVRADSGCSGSNGKPPSGPRKSSRAACRRVPTARAWIRTETSPSTSASG